MDNDEQQTPECETRAFEGLFNDFHHNYHTNAKIDMDGITLQHTLASGRTYVVFLSVRESGCSYWVDVGSGMQKASRLQDAFIVFAKAVEAAHE